MQRSVRYLVLLVAVAGWIGCSKMEDYHQDFIKNGEIVYTGRADSLRVYPGRNRIALSWLLLSDPSIVQCKVYWDDRSDSVTIPVKRTAGVDTVKIVLNNLTEKAYTFDIYTYDAAGHSSVKVDTIGMVYGDNYAGALFNRPFKSITHSTDTARLEWSGVSSQCIGVEIHYTDRQGLARTIWSYPADKLTKLPLLSKGSSFTYRSLFVPARNAIDTFYTAYETKLIP